MFKTDKIFFLPALQDGLKRGLAGIRCGIECCDILSLAQQFIAGFEPLVELDGPVGVRKGCTEPPLNWMIQEKM